MSPTKIEYINVCELIWGCVPIDQQWAIGTNIFKEMYNKIYSNARIQS